MWGICLFAVIWHDRARLSWAVSRSPTGSGSRTRTLPLTARLTGRGFPIDYAPDRACLPCRPVYGIGLRQRLAPSHAALARFLDGPTCHTPLRGIDGLPGECPSCSPAIVRWRACKGSMREAMGSRSYCYVYYPLPAREWIY